VRGDGGAGPLGRRPGGVVLDELPRQRGGVGVEAEADLAAALLYERREPIREGL
jgi:hypothetical protein